ncbi:hypothetical protein [Mucilaginibacter agri]|uniref:Uncharacterized protein n=1 Tax=Mucilaginibacter agri TaxID=2695265 RepID=A0A965ZKZ9_9SPHI|nr:hypothetical protein [Mucilaginibacter agri]NCD71894.1 hypothetical protein [Mucilaginibacter agri]
MVTKEDLQAKYATYSTAQLLDLIDHKFDYTELAVSIAIEELSKRNVSEEDIKEYKESKVENVATYIRKNIVDDLTLLQKNVFYFLWVPFVRGAIKMNFHDDGSILKLKQANYYQFYGFIFFLIAGVISVKFDLDVWATAAVWILFFIPTYLFDESFNRNRLYNKLKDLYNISDEPENDNVIK